MIRELTIGKAMSTDAKERQRILVVDNNINDNQDMLTLLNRALELEGFDTIIVADYDEATTILEKLNPDMVIMDTFLPDVESVHEIDVIREHSNVPIVVITADTDIETLKTVFAHGADDLVHKPFGIKHLIARIKAKLRRYHHEVYQTFY